MSKFVIWLVPRILEKLAQLQTHSGVDWDRRKTSGNPLVTNLEGILLHKLSNLKQTYNDAQQLLYALSPDVKTKEAIKWLSEARSAEEIAELKGIDVDYVKFLIETAEHDGLYKI